jgi:hypothetical protein
MTSQYVLNLNPIKLVAIKNFDTLLIFPNNKIIMYKDQWDLLKIRHRAEHSASYE